MAQMGTLEFTATVDARGVLAVAEAMDLMVRLLDEERESLVYAVKEP